MRKNQLILLKRLKRQRTEVGLTVIEILVAIAIMAVLIGVGATTMIRFRATVQLTNAADELKLNLKEARRSALSSVHQGDPHGGAVGQAWTYAYVVEFGLGDNYDLRRWQEAGSYNEGLISGNLGSLSTVKSSLKSDVYSGVTSLDSYGYSGGSSTGEACRYIAFQTATGQTHFYDSSGQQHIDWDSCVMTLENYLGDVIYVEVLRAGSTVRVKRAIT